MADLTACYFCGTVEQLGEYPVIPQELYPPESLQRTVVVCPTCRDKLAQALEPILSYFELPEDEVEEQPPSSKSAQEEGETSESEGIDDPIDEATRPEEEDKETPIAAAPDSALPDGANSVARLLQNRAFPVERMDLVDLAASAYDLEEATCHDILDAFVDRGYLVEEEGEFRRPAPAPTPEDVEDEPTTEATDDEAS